MRQPILQPYRLGLNARHYTLKTFQPAGYLPSNTLRSLANESAEQKQVPIGLTNI
jgi:hypothetical protein